MNDPQKREEAAAMQPIDHVTWLRLHEQRTRVATRKAALASFLPRRVDEAPVPTCVRIPQRSSGELGRPAPTVPSRAA